MRKILIIGGTGSLGNVLTLRFLNENDTEIYLYSRDECKHWGLNIEYGYNPRVHFIVGNVNDPMKVEQTLVRHDFEIIILAAAMKHIDKCEYETNECLNTNLLGTQTVLNCIESHQQLLPSLQKVCFISTDKACSPVNIYGMCKAASELLVVEKARYIPSIKFVCVRYGNVLNSRGSIIPTLHKLGRDDKVKHFILTDKGMTRFVMTLEQSVDLVFHALEKADSGDIVIPKLVSCRIEDMLQIFSELYQKEIKLGKLRPGEKMLESLINETQSARLVTGNDGYTYIRPAYRDVISTETIRDYNSTINPMSKTELKAFLKDLNLL